MEYRRKKEEIKERNDKVKTSDERRHYRMDRQCKEMK